MEIEPNSLQIVVMMATEKGGGGQREERKEKEKKNIASKAEKIQSERLSVILAGKSERNKKHIVTVQMWSR